MENKYDAVMQSVQFRYVPGAVGVTEAMIQAFERDIGHRLPDDYRHFLATYGFSAGRAYTCYGDIEHGGQATWDNQVGAFYGLGEHSVHDLRGELRVYRTLGLPQQLLPIAGNDAGKICLALTGPDTGRVYEWICRPGLRTGDLKQDLRLVAPNFDTFIRSLRRIEGGPPAEE